MSDIIDSVLSQLRVGVQREGVLYVPMMMPMMPIRKEDAKPYGVSVCVATHAIKMQATMMAIVPLTAGSVASSNFISMV
jgi:hypothetical protein